MYRLLEHSYLHFVFVYFYLFGGIASLKNKYVPKKIDCIVFVIYTQCVVCKAGMEFLSVIWNNFVIHCVKLYFIPLLLKIWNMSAIKSDNPCYLLVAQANKWNKKQTKLKYITFLKLTKICISKPRLFPIFIGKLCFKTCVLTWFIIMLKVMAMLTLRKICICCNNNNNNNNQIL